MRRWLGALDSGDQAVVFGLIDEIAAENYVLHTGGSTVSDRRDVLGREGLRNHVKAAYQTFGDMQHRVEDEFGDGDRLVTRAQFSANHIGEFLGIGPTGARIECSVIYVQHFQDGRIRECWIDWDSLLTVSGQLEALSRSRADQNEAGVRRTIERNNTNAMRWYAAGEIDSLVGLFAPDCRQMGPHLPPVVGREAFRAFWAEAFRLGTWTFTLLTEQVTVSGSMALERGRYTYTFTPFDGPSAGVPPVSDRGNYLVEWRSDNGRWLIVNDIATSELPLPTGGGEALRRPVC